MASRRQVGAERRYGNEGAFWARTAHHSFVRSFTLPVTLDSGDVVADLRDGMLSLTVAKREEARPRAIPIGGAHYAPQLPAASAVGAGQR
jgi:HSP20 family molecular chaperone IbpA